MCLPKQSTGAAKQYLATIIGCLLCLNFGLMFGASTSHGTLYQSTETPLKKQASNDSCAWATAWLFYGVALGACVLGYLWQFIGSKGIMLMSGLLQIGGWGCVHFASDIIHIQFSRLFVGIASGAVFVVFPTFIQDITEFNTESRLIAMMDLWRTAGILLGTISGYYLNHELVALMGLFIAMAFQLAFAFIDEAPIFYVQNKDVCGLEKSLRWYRGIRSAEAQDKYEYHAELEHFKRGMRSPPAFFVTKIPFSYTLKMFIIVLALSLGSQVNGAYVFLYFGKALLDRIDGPIVDNQHVLILGLLQVIGAFFALHIMLKTRRKLVILSCSFVCSISMLIYALLIHLGSQSKTYPLYMSWLSNALLWLNIFLINFGLQAFITTFIVELTPRELRSKTVSIATATSWFLLSVIIQFFDYLTVLFGLPSCMVIFATATMIVLLLCTFFVPETRNRAAEDIQLSMGYTRSAHIPRNTTVDGHITLDNIRY